MDKTVMLAVAGAGKTYYIANTIDSNKKNLILAFTHRNIYNIESEIISRFGAIPDLTTVMTFDAFKYRYVFLPYEPTIIDRFSLPDFISRGLTPKSPPSKTIKRGNSYIPNPRYRKKDNIEHYTHNSQYYISTLSELIMYSKKSLIKRIAKNLDSFFDCIYIDEFQDYREYDYEMIIALTKHLNSVLFVGDYYQHSVIADKNSGKPFSKKTYAEYIALIKDAGLSVDETTLSKTRRCPQNICSFIQDKLQVKIEAKNHHTGEVILVKEKIHDILNDDSIIKLVHENSSKYSFRAINWSYSKGDTYENICVILTEKFEGIFDSNFSLKSASDSQITNNKLYVAMTRTKGNLYIIKFSDFKAVEPYYMK